MSRPIAWSRIAISPANLTLANTLPVGQSFLWHRRPLPDVGPSQPKEEFSRVVGNRVVLLRQDAEGVHYAVVSKAEEDLDLTRRWLEDYFHLKRYPDLEEMYKDWRERDPGLFGKTELDTRAIGVRVLRQDPWECLIAFITSTNNHISRISSLMHKLATEFSPELLTFEGVAYHAFPPPHAFPASLEGRLRELGFGYRAGFIESSLATLREEFGDQPGSIEAGLEVWRHQPVEKVREKLIRLKGVGRKVADCVMLMCLDQPSLIPVDVHVAAIAARHPAFPSKLRNKPMSKLVYDETQGFLAEKWGPMGGWTQAVMFAADLPVKNPSKRKATLVQGADCDLPEAAILVPKGDASTLLEREPSIEDTSRREAVDMSAVHGFKRTRSATRVQLLRTSSIPGVAEGVEGLGMTDIRTSEGLDMKR